MPRKTEYKNDIEMMAQLIRSALCDIRYHERALKNAHKRVAVARALIERCGLHISDDEALEGADDDDDNIDDYIDLAKQTLGLQLENLLWHERELKLKHAELAQLKAIRLRGAYTDAEVSIEKISMEVEEQLKKKNEINGSKIDE